MKNKLNYQINELTVVLYFGFACFKELAAIWNVAGYQGVTAKLATFGNITDDLTFDQMDIMGDLIVASLRSNPDRQPEIEREEIMNDMMNDVLKVVPVIEALVAAIHKPAESNPKPVKGSGKGKPAKK